jgi:NTP pyrophosphatase (non-canonical NTP hydrolase)
MNLNDIQNLAAHWNRVNFGGHFGTGYRNLLGLSEEVGELCHAHLKGEQGIRHTPEEILSKKKDAIGDIVIFLCNYCDSQNISLEECVYISWKEIENRKYNKAVTPQSVAAVEFVEGEMIETKWKDIANLLTNVAQILDVIKIEWGESWSAFDQEQRDKISEVLKEYYSKREENKNE